ncbi:MAG: hypothetical protein IPH21_03405 [Flavobacteriales bacterium]|nr:hypothetical protein [Flavobacteriales bacterium]
MAERIFLEVNIDGLDPLISIRSLSVQQSIFAHHKFDLVVPSASIEPDNEKLFDIIAELVGKDITIDWETGTFKENSQGTDASSFKGIITDVSVYNERGNYMNVRIQGASPTILMDGVPNTNSFSELKLKPLYESVIASNLVNKLQAEDNLSYAEKIPFSIQYNETDFNYMCRIMHQCGEWFYYDGQTISLGVKTGKELKLTPDRTGSLHFGFNLSGPVAQVRGWDYLKHDKFEVKGASPSHDDANAQLVEDTSVNLYPASDANFMPHPSIPEGEELFLGKDAVKQRLDNLKQGKSNAVFSITGSSDLAEMQVGATIALEGFAYGGNYIVMSVTHSCNGRDNYSNQFHAVPVNSGIPAEVPILTPKMNDCVAVVTDNKDPEKMGRVKVQFPWGAAISPWLRMVQPHTGKGRGFYFVPEINDEVMVGFEMGMAEVPYVIGTLYNGKNKQDKHYDDDNKIKAIKTLGGNEIIFNDNGVLTIRNGKNSMVLSCKDDGVLTIASKGDINFEAGKNMNITVGEEFTMSVGKNYALDVAADLTMSGGGNMKASAGKNMELAAGMDNAISASKNLTLDGTAKASMSAAQTTVMGNATVELKGGALTTIKGGIVQIN